MKTINIEELKDYKVTKDGQIFSTITNKVLKQRLNKDGYFDIKLKGKTYKVHRLVGLTYIINHNNLSQINHIDGIKTNNNLSNLEWCNNSYNQIHAYSIGLHKKQSPINIKLSNNIAKQIREEYLLSNISQRKLALKYNVSKTTIADILNGKYYNINKNKTNINRLPTQKKILTSQISEIIEKYNTGLYSYNKLGKEYGVNHKTIIKYINIYGQTTIPQDVEIHQ